METTKPETQDQSSAAKSFDLDAMGLGPPAKVRRRGKVHKLTRVLRTAVVLLLVFNIGVRLGHGSRPTEKTPAGEAGGAPGDRGGAEDAEAGAPKPAVSGTIKVVDGNVFYVSQPDGTTKKVVAADSTRFTRTVPAESRDIQPGDSVSVEGSTQPDGSVSAVRIDGEASTLQQG